jgi:hypothetical protein
MKIIKLFILISLIFLAGCDNTAPELQSAQINTHDNNLQSNELKDGDCYNKNPNRNAFFGDLHVHTSYSFDAVAGKLGITPDDANRYAQGEEIPFFPLNDKGMPAGIAKIDRPLDFLAVTDHGEFLGEWSMCTNKDSDYFDSGFCSEQYRAQEGSPLMLFGPIIAQKIPKRNV